jgi:hypothetical protein
MSESEKKEIEQRIEIKKQLILLTEVEIKALEEKLNGES